MDTIAPGQCGDCEARDEEPHTCWERRERTPCADGCGCTSPQQADASECACGGQCQFDPRW